MRIMFLNQQPRRSRDDGSHERVQALLSGYASPGTKVQLCYPDDTGVRVEESIRSELPYAVTLPALIRKAVWAEQNGYDAVIQSNTFDPGVEASRLAVRIPVIGLCRTTVLAAACLADRIGITVPFDGYDLVARRLLRAYGLLHFATDIRSFSMTGFDMPRDEIAARAAETMRALVRETGAECIVPLGGAVIPYVVSTEELEQEVGVPVLNTKAIGIHFAETCVHLGLSQSPRAYPKGDLHLEDFAATALAP